jgi:hypothetical protein
MSYLQPDYRGDEVMRLRGDIIFSMEDRSGRYRTEYCIYTREEWRRKFHVAMWWAYEVDPRTEEEKRAAAEEEAAATAYEAAVRRGQVRRSKLREEPLRGYCEKCRITYITGLDAHCEMPLHVAFVNNVRLAAMVTNLHTDNAFVAGGKLGSAGHSFCRDAFVGRVGRDAARSCPGAPRNDTCR